MSPEKAEAASPERLLQRRSSRSLTAAEEEVERRELRRSLTASGGGRGARAGGDGYRRIGQGGVVARGMRALQGWEAGLR